MSYSVLMSVYFKETSKNLNRCFSSLYLQSIPIGEIILVLDGPISDELHSNIIHWSQKLPIRQIPLKKNVGLGKALNIGLSYCSFELVARMDTDDICMPFRFQKQLEAFRNYPKLDICGSHIIEFDQNPDTILSTRRLPLLDEDIKRSAVKFNPFNHMTVMYKRSSVELAGGYKDLPWMEDWYLWLRMIANNNMCMNIDEYLVKAQTGKAMIERRSGINYISSEWALAKIKVNLSLSSWPESIMMFLFRSFPRLLPKKILFSLYIFSRKL